MGKLGDIDGDGRVDEADLSILLEAMDAKPNDPAWKTQADLDGDGEITSTDLSILLNAME